LVKKKILTLGIILLSVFIVVACNDNDPDTSEEEAGLEEPAQQEVQEREALDIEAFDSDEPLLLINGEEVTRADFDAQFERTKQMVGQQYGIDLEAEENTMLIPELQHQTIENLIGQRVLTQEAEEQGMEVTEEQLNENINTLIQQFGGPEGFQEALEADNLTEEDLELLVYEELLISQLFEAELNFDSIEVSDEEIEEFYAQYQLTMEQQGEEVSPLEEIEEQIALQLKQQKSQEEQQTYISTLMDQSEIERLY
jgi:hypothetical protein